MHAGATLLAREAQPIHLDYYWGDAPGQLPVPRLEFRAPPPAAASASAAGLNGAGYLFDTGANAPFDFTSAMRLLVADVVTRCPLFAHVDLAQLHFGVTRARKDRKHGLQAKITPMRFPGGERIRRRYGRWYCVQRYWLEGTELLYLMTFCMPRFLNQGFDEKLVTIFHELFHIAPEFNGDLRWHEGRYRVHTRSQKKLDTEMAGLAREYLHGGADPGLHAFLRLSFDELIARHGRIVCLALPMPKLVPVG